MADSLPVFPVPMSVGKSKRPVGEVLFRQDGGFVTVDATDHYRISENSANFSFTVWDGHGRFVGHAPVLLRDSSLIGFGVLELADHRLCTYLTETPDPRHDYRIAWWEEPNPIRKRKVTHSIPPAAIWNPDGTLVSVVNHSLGQTAFRLHDGRVITGHDGRSQHLLDPDLSSPRPLPSHGGFIDSMVELPTGKIVTWSTKIAGKTAGTIWIRDGISLAATTVRALPSGYRIRDVHVLSNGNLFVLSPRDAGAIVDPITTTVLKGTSIPRGNKAVWESTDGSIFLAVAGKGVFRVVRENERFGVEPVFPYKLRGSPSFLHDGRVTSTVKGTVELLDWRGSTDPTELRGHTGHIIGLRQLPDETILTWAKGSVDRPSDYYGSHGDEDTSLRLWEPEGIPLAILGRPQDRRYWSLQNELSVTLWNGTNVMKTIGYGQTGGARLTFSSYKRPDSAIRAPRSQPGEAARQMMKDFSAVSSDDEQRLLVALRTPWALSVYDELPLEYAKMVVALEISDPSILETALPVLQKASLRVLQITVPRTVTRIDNLYGLDVPELRFVRCARLEVVSGLNCNCQTVTVHQCPVLTDVQISGPLGAANVVYK